jgi:hypothetical protein
MGNREPVQSGRVSRVRGRFTRWQVIVVACLLASVGMGLVLWLRPGRSLESRLREIDAAYAIPEEENAARAYTELAWDYKGPYLDMPLPFEDIQNVICMQPWRSTDYPQVAQWVEDNRPTIDALMDISRKPNCRFSVWEARWQGGKREAAARQWHMLLLQAANNDLGEGRTEAGLEKLLLIFQMARRFHTQIDPWDNDIGRSFLWVGLRRFDRLVMLEEVPQEWLARFEAALPPAENGWNENAKQVEAVRALCEREYQRGVIKRLMSIFTQAKSARTDRESELLYLGQCRVARILLALRLYRNEAGVWPGSLREIESRVSPEALIDPPTGKPLVYRLTGDRVLVYSIGLNLIDDGGRLDSGGWAGDDFLYWAGR